MAIAVPGRRPKLEAPRPLTMAVATLRRYPTVPGAILLVLLVVPSLFVEVLALHRAGQRHILAQTGER